MFTKQEHKYRKIIKLPTDNTDFFIRWSNHNHCWICIFHAHKSRSLIVPFQRSRLGTASSKSRVFFLKIKQSDIFALVTFRNFVCYFGALIILLGHDIYLRICKGQLSRNFKENSSRKFLHLGTSLGYNSYSVSIKYPCVSYLNTGCWCPCKMQYSYDANEITIILQTHHVLHSIIWWPLYQVAAVRINSSEGMLWK